MVVSKTSIDSSSRSNESLIPTTKPAYQSNTSKKARHNAGFTTPPTKLYSLNRNSLPHLLQRFFPLLFLRHQHIHINGINHRELGNP